MRARQDEPKERGGRDASLGSGEKGLEFWLIALRGVTDSRVYFCMIKIQVMGYLELRLSTLQLLAMGVLGVWVCSCRF